MNSLEQGARSRMERHGPECSTRSGMMCIVQDGGAQSGMMECNGQGWGYTVWDGGTRSGAEARLLHPRRAAGTADAKRARPAVAATPLATAAPSANTRIGRSITTSAGRLCKGCRPPPPPPPVWGCHRVRASPTGWPPSPAAPARRARRPLPAPARQPPRLLWRARPAEPPSDCRRRRRYRRSPKDTDCTRCNFLSYLTRVTSETTSLALTNNPHGSSNWALSGVKANTGLLCSLFGLCFGFFWLVFYLLGDCGSGLVFCSFFFCLFVHWGFFSFFLSG